MPTSAHRTAAVHEAGHATLAVLLRLQPRYVFIDRSRCAGGTNGNWPEKDFSGCTADFLRRYIAMCLAGRIAEATICGEVCLPSAYGPDNDVASAAAAYLGREKQTAQREILSGTVRACELVQRHRLAIRRVASALLRRGFLTASEIAAAMKPRRQSNSRQVIAWK